MNRNALDSIARHPASISDAVMDQSEQWRTFIAMASEVTSQLTRIADSLDAAKVLAERRRKNREHMATIRRQSVCTQERTEEAKEGKIPHTPLKEEREEEKKDFPVCSRVCAREADLDALFDRFWKAYPGPRKTDKRKCRAKLRTILAAGGNPNGTFDQILAGLERWKKSLDWTKDGGAFICAPLVWLNNERWDAEVAPAPTVTRFTTRKADNWRGTRKEDIGDVLG